jgi:predicted RNase H-like nuclease (RuvC/YqgF family)
MERARKREIEELKNIHENKISSLKHQIRELERHIEDKNRVINTLKSQYEDLSNKFEEVFSQRAAQKNLDIKIPGWIPDTLATKNLFDVFLKNKVLEYCS